MASINGLANGHVYSNGVEKPTTTPSHLFPLDDPNSIESLKSYISQSTTKSTYPNCKSIVQNIPIYDLSTHTPPSPSTISTLQSEWHSILHTGPGVFILKNFFPTTSYPALTASNRAFNSIIAREESANATSKKGDHFAGSGANSRIWNSLQKHAFEDPASFVSYYSNPWLKYVSESWLGPAYTVTAQVNIVRPGGKPQMPHRDYHLGFQTAEQCARWPRTMHRVSQFLTLQGAVAHSDMPLESGPTRFLPYSQLLEDGYMAWRSEEVKAYFHDEWVSMPLEMGDAVFFNPALIHAAGENVTEKGERGVDRSANLLQISSAFGKTMEKIDFEGIVGAVWEELRRDTGLGEVEMESLVQAMTDGYPFPTNLDRRPPAPGGMAPESMTEIVLRFAREGRTKEEVVAALKQFREDSSA